MVRLESCWCASLWDALSLHRFRGFALSDGEKEDRFKELLGQVEGASKGLSTLTFTLVAACLFSLLTCGTFTDAQLITKSSVTAGLPGVGLSLPVQRFLQSAPWILLLFQVYFLVNLHSYEMLVMDLSQTYEGEVHPLCTRVSLSIFNSLVSDADRNFVRAKRGILVLEKPLALILGYILVPFTIWIIWFRALALHGMDFHLPLFTLIALSFSLALSISHSNRYYPVRHGLARADRMAI